MPPNEPSTPPVNAESSSAESVDVAAFLAQISTRLITAQQASEVQALDLEDSIATEHLQVVIFLVADQHYALSIDGVGEILREQTTTPVPGMPDWLLGVTNLHGDIVSVVDLHAFLSGSRRDLNNSSVLVAQVDDQRIGLLVRRVEITYTFPLEQLQSPLFVVDDDLVPFLRGVFEWRNDLVRLLDGRQLLLGHKMQQFG
ncbi:MAG: purine-binding chemotaxis protein CheW [Chloroflexi bacterium]|nr:purine-binding chemotaxis protein CheW [Chloroflexota bacterium]